MEIYICPTCGNIIEKIKNNGPAIMCCGKPVVKMEANTTEAAVEKHIPEVKEDGDMLTISVGSTLHPMTEDHYIEWILVMDGDKLVERFNLNAGDTPVVKTFKRENLEIYAYCNLHGLWKLEK